VRLVVKTATPVCGVIDSKPLDLRRYVVEALRTKENSSLGSSRAGYAYTPMQVGFRAAGMEIKIDTSSLGIEPDATASASRIVDFPDPFSPTKYVTVAKASPSRFCTTGNENG
jgi:hypothetical protein